MIEEEEYFRLSGNHAYVEGAVRALLIDKAGENAYRVNEGARGILRLAEKGCSIDAACRILGPDIEPDDVRGFIRELAAIGAILTYPEPPPSAPSPRTPPELRFLWIETTDRCNLRCVHCYADAKPGSSRFLPTKAIERILAEAAALGCASLQFTGGECTLCGGLLGWIETARGLGFSSIEIFTNGTRLTQGFVRGIADRGAKVAVSVYSHRPEIHDRITGVPGSWARTMRGIELLCAFGVPRRGAIVAMSANEADLDDTLYFLRRIGLPTTQADPIRPAGRANDGDLWPKAYGESTARAGPACGSGRPDVDRNRSWNSCWFGKAAITSGGDVLPCIFARGLETGNVLERGLGDIVFGEKMQGYWGLSLDKVDICKDCEYRYLCTDCRPWALGYSGDLFGPNPRCAYDPHSTGEDASPFPRIDR